MILLVYSGAFGWNVKAFLVIVEKLPCNVQACLGFVVAQMVQCCRVWIICSCCKDCALTVVTTGGPFWCRYFPGAFRFLCWSV